MCFYVFVCVFVCVCMSVEIDVFVRVCEGRLKCLYVCVSGD